ncbi:DUF2721 domain-containing protein [Methylobacterium sp. Leaf118]|uniref:DUF2721 domain-containing protein n=1 Tax=Methylobacterium sp. Leaf118 TaxID=2876562 RepID=UPI001E36517B|nr:DUF2721 domain-containing protein [Methylobacterium sp. Leaf118]
MFPTLSGAGDPESIAHIIQVALAPAFLLSALATLLNVFSTRLGRVADKVDRLTADLVGAGPEEAAALAQRLAYLRRRSGLLDAAVVMASLGGVMTGVAVLTLFVGALRDASAASILFACFGLALLCTVGALVAFMAEILLAGRGVRRAAAQGQGRGQGEADGPAAAPGPGQAGAACSRNAS